MPHNGKRIQTNPEPSGTEGNWPFLNMMKIFPNWTYADNTFPFDWINIDADGYPTVSAHFGAKTGGEIPLQSVRPGNYIVKYSGGSSSSSVQVSGNTSTIVSATGPNGRATFVPDSTTHQIQVNISECGSPHLTGLVLCHADDEAAYDAGEIFGVRFKSLMSQLGVIRFMNWTNTNVTNMSKWEDRKPFTYYSYYAPYYPSNRMSDTFTTTGTGNTYALAFTGFSLVDKAQVIFIFHHDQTTGGATLNINGTGAKTILNQYGDNSRIGGPPPASDGVAANAISCATYDQSLDAYLVNSYPFQSVGIDNGVPPEICLRLAIEVGAHPWFCAPYLSCDTGTGQLPGLTNYMTSLATYVRDNAPSWMIPRYEPPNECWNAGIGFYSTRYAYNKQTVRQGAASDNDWYGTIGSLIGQAISAVYGADRTKYQMILGYGGYFNYPPTFGSNAARVESTFYVAHGGSAAQNWATHICYANYFNSRAANTPKLMTLAYQHFNAGTTAAKNAILDEYLGYVNHPYDGLFQQGGFSLPQFEVIVAGYKAFADGKGLAVTHYEGGYSPDFWFDGWINFATVTKGATTVLSVFSVGLLHPKSDWAVAVAGMSVNIFGTGTALDGGPYTVLSASPTACTINVNSTGFGSVGGGSMQYTSVDTTVNPMQLASKFRPAIVGIQLGSYAMLGSYGTQFPSEFSFCGNGSPFTIWDPDIWVSPDPPRWQAVEEFNSLAEPVVDVSIRRPRIRLR